MSSYASCTTLRDFDYSDTISVRNFDIDEFMQRFSPQNKLLASVSSETTKKSSSIFGKSKTESQVCSWYEVKRINTTVYRSELMGIFGEMIYFSIEEEKRANVLFESRCEILPINLMDL